MGCAVGPRGRGVVQQDEPHEVSGAGLQTTSRCQACRDGRPGEGGTRGVEVPAHRERAFTDFTGLFDRKSGKSYQFCPVTNEKKSIFGFQEEIITTTRFIVKHVFR